MRRKGRAVVAALGLALVLAGCGSREDLSEIDISTSAWLDAYMEQTLSAYGRDFTQSAAFSYSGEEGKFVLLYATKAGVGELRDYYVAEYAAQESGRNDDTALDLTVELEEATARIVNYYSPVSRVVEQELRPAAALVGRVREQVEAAFPQTAAEQALEGTGLLDGQVYGGYVRYTYDDLDPYFEQGAPIFSRAFLDPLGERGYQAALEGLRDRYPQHSYVEAENATYFQMEQGVLSLSRFTNGEQKEIVSISLQITP